MYIYKNYLVIGARADSLTYPAVSSCLSTSLSIYIYPYLYLLSIICNLSIMEVLTLSQKVASGLQAAEAAGADAAKKACRFIYQSAAASAAGAAMPAVPEGVREEVLAALSTVVFEAARTQAEPAQLM